ncbi:hypothetical protein PanWU01x14_242000 [Parasponia andersonii]|uniref:Uncharacterized protein n=1 Tax=Parasponia andersonii TaxID=3476 RepID=A0A2P5BGA1_PARAD|nr:hypothetical protein PanWU01x14_242000 [Parasponia andersonii]
MERSKSIPGHYSSLYGDGRFGFEDRSKSYSFNGPSSQAADDEFASSGNPEMKRRKRVAAYNMYAMEGVAAVNRRFSPELGVPKVFATAPENRLLFLPSTSDQLTVAVV